MNIRVEVTLTQQSPDELEKTVTLVAADGQPGMLRTVVEFPRVPGAESAGLEQAPLGVDVMPRILDTGKIRVRLSVNYNVPRPGQGTEPAKGATQARAMLSETLTVLLDDGKPQLVSQSADALGSRSVGLTVKASVLK